MFRSVRTTSRHPEARARPGVRLRRASGTIGAVLLRGLASLGRLGVTGLDQSGAQHALARRRTFELGVYGLGHLVQPLLVRLAVDHVGDVAVRPVERADLAVDVVAQRAVRSAGARAVERDALA